MVGRQHGVCRKGCRENVANIVEKVVPIGDHNPADGLLAEFSNLGKLGGQPFDEVFGLAGQVHLALADALDGPIESGPVAVVIFADREQPFEIVSGPVETQCREPPGSAAVAVQKGINVHKLKLRDAAYQHRVRFCFAAEIVDQLGFIMDTS